jgi:hypothetical protein
MKTVLLILAAVSIFPLAQAEVVLPPDVQIVVDQRAAAIATIDMAYVQKLEKLKQNYTKQGNLEAANRVVELIQNNQKDRIHKMLKAKWVLELDIPGDKRKLNREFDDTHMIAEDGTRQGKFFFPLNC